MVGVVGRGGEAAEEAAAARARAAVMAVVEGHVRLGVVITDFGLAKSATATDMMRTIVRMPMDLFLMGRRS